MFYFDPIYFLIVGPAMLLALYAQIRVKSAFSRWNEVPVASRTTGREAAQRVLQAAGLDHVQIEEHAGFLSDHYDPRSRTLRLSPDVYRSATVAAVGVAAHEAGHAVQHAQNYVPLKFRSAIVP